ncbi:T9SS type A sorting domain-containing protein [Pseudocnuella soli]|uniref:T9SS type A sorting domain-containing protein n=1 Tax=Pseudocnuella soli TaxID=2502779 RepID=UPI001044B62F|nr:T9SS type A sorting domain-containing protein [Pseudocnuella soli]
MKKVVAKFVMLLCFYTAAVGQDVLPKTNLSANYLDNYSFLSPADDHLDPAMPLIVDGVGVPGGFTPFIFGVTGTNGTLFSTITPLSPIPIGSTDTQHKPQAKTWFHAGKWWAALPPSVGGTRLFRLDGTSWTQVMTIASSGSRTDCWVDGNLVHILMFKGSGTNQIATLEYDANLGTYKAWNRRATPTSLSLPSGVESATITVDGTGRMWVAADAVNDILVYWSDAPYTSWSSGINVASGINSDDISLITKLPGRVGVFWSNQNTGLFGFRTHVDGTSASSWTADELPASQNAIPGNKKMADDHMNATVASDGTLYVAAKTSYNSGSLPQLIMLVRRPNGVWDNLYPITIGDGTQAIVLLNEALGKLKVVYSSQTNGGEILYRESATANISFSSAATLMGSVADDVNFASSTHQTYTNEVVVVATKQAAPRQIIGVMASDGAPTDVTPPVVSGIVRQTPADETTNANSVTFGVTFSEAVTGVDVSDFSLTTGGTVQGAVANVSGSGTAYAVTVNNISGAGTLRLDLKGAGTGITDAAGNAISGGFNSGQSYTIVAADVTAPVVSGIVRQSPLEQNTSATTVSFGVTFSEAVSGVDATDFTLSTGGTAQGSIQSVSGSGSSYVVTVGSISGSGSLGLNVKSSGTGITDGAGNGLSGGFSGGETYNVSPADVTAPTVTSINRQTPAEETTNANSVIFGVTFSEAVTGVDVSDFSLTTGGTVQGTVASVSGSGTTYAVTVNNISGAGTLRLDLKGAGTGITDAAGNAISGGFNSGQSYTIVAADVTAPVVSGIVRQSPLEQNTSATTVSFGVTFSEGVSGVDATDFTLSTGGTAQGSIQSVSGSGSSYVVTVGSISGSGSLGLSVKGSGTGITDGEGNGLSGGFSGGETYNVSPADVTAPTVIGINRQSPIEQNTSATGVTFAINFSEPVNGVDITDFQITKTGDVSGTIGQLRGACSGFTITVINISGTGTIRLDLKSAGTNIVDAEGNAISGGYTSGQIYEFGSQGISGSTTVNPPKRKPKGQTSISASERVDLEVQAKPMTEGISAQVFPNPFNNQTSFSFKLASNEEYSVWLGDSWGRQLQHLGNGKANANTEYRIRIDGSRLTPGFYLLTIKYGSQMKILKLVKE